MHRTLCRLSALAALAALAACTVSGTVNQPAPSEAAAPALSPAEQTQQARTECWMRIEKQNAAQNIDKRIALVDKCVSDKMKAQAAQ